jgi:hypothetical protein
VVLLLKQKCGETLCTSPLIIWENEARCRNANADSVLRNYFLGEGFAKPRLSFLKFGGDFGFRPRGGGVWGGIRAGFLSDFWRGGQEKY